MLIYRYLVTCLLFVICRYTGTWLLVFALLYVDIQVLGYLSMFCYMSIYRSFVVYVLLYVDIQVLGYLSMLCYMLIYRYLVTVALFVIC